LLVLHFLRATLPPKTICMASLIIYIFIYTGAVLSGLRNRRGRETSESKLQIKAPRCGTAQEGYGSTSTEKATTRHEEASIRFVKQKKKKQMKI
jgi:hypothetical protein